MTVDDLCGHHIGLSIRVWAEPYGDFPPTRLEGIFRGISHLAFFDVETQAFVRLHNDVSGLVPYLVNRTSQVELL